MGIAAVTAIGVISSLIIGAVLIPGSKAPKLLYVGLAMAGLVSAVIWGLIGVDVVWVISWTGSFDSDKRFTINKCGLGVLKRFGEVRRCCRLADPVKLHVC